MAIPVDWSRYQHDPLALTKLLRYPVAPNSPDRTLLLGCAKRLPRVGVVDADPQTIAALMIWRTACYNNDTTTVVITSNMAWGQSHVELAEVMISESAQAVRDRVWVLKDKRGLMQPAATKAAVVVTRPQILDVEQFEEARLGHLLILIPDVDQIPGCYLRSAAALSRKPNISVIFNVAK